jgi:glyoxylase-like metal-dependent hydrolase (beta-lactamase superfamily II)
MTALLVRHPRGDLLIDTGLGRGVEAHFAQLPFLFRAMSPYQRKPAAVDQLRAVGYDPRQLRAILLTHAHWDHVSGIPDFPGTPVWVTAEERSYIRDGGVVTVVARGFTSAQYREYSFEPRPYLGFPRSHDVHGDGSVVIVPAPGHTPGSVVIFLTPPRGPRYAMVGDLAWQREGIHERAERPWLLRTLIDSDAASVRRDLLRMFAITQRFPALHVIPAHDARAFAELPTLDQLKR